MSNSPISSPRTGGRALLMGLLLCLFGPVPLPAFAQSGGAQTTTCHPAARDYLNLPELTLKSGHKPDYIPEWRSSAKRVDRYGREVAPLANAAGAVLSASRYSEDLGHSLRTAAINFWRAFDESGQVPEIIKQDYAYFILNVWGHNSSMAGLNRMTGNADAGFITGTASVPRPSFWERIPNGAQGEELLKLAVQADYLNYSQCSSGGDSVDKQIERVLLRNQTLGYWHFVPEQLKKMQLDAFTDDEKSRILDAMIQDARSGRQSHDVSSSAAIRAWLGNSPLSRERARVLQSLKATATDRRFSESDDPETLRANVPMGWGELFSVLYKRIVYRNRDAGAGAQLFFDEFVSFAISPHQTGRNDLFQEQMAASPILAMNTLTRGDNIVLGKISNPFSLTVDPIDALNCGMDKTVEAGMHLFDAYPLAYLSDIDVGLSEFYAGNPFQPPSHGAFQLAYVSCALSVPFGDDNQLSRVVRSRYASAHEKRQKAIDAARPAKAEQFLTPLANLPTFEALLSEKADQRLEICLRKTSKDAHDKICYCPRTLVGTWAQMREEDLVLLHARSSSFRYKDMSDEELLAMPAAVPKPHDRTMFGVRIERLLSAATRECIL